MTAADKDAKQFFTIDEANQRLPLVKMIVKDIVDLYRDVQDRRDRLATVLRSRGDSAQDGVNRMYSEEVEQIESDILKDERTLGGFIDELKQLGIEFRDPVKGLVDFPTRIEGREVYLCWKLGEAEVHFWHDLDAGFDGRQSLTEVPVVAGQESDEK
jgi:hypothetical protein